MVIVEKIAGGFKIASALPFLQVIFTKLLPLELLPNQVETYAHDVFMAKLELISDLVLAFLLLL